MNIVGKNVTHIKFGKGVIVNRYSDKMEVNFGSYVKSFLYPAAFEVFFRTEDKETEQFISGELKEFNRIKTENEREREVLRYRKTTRSKAGSHGIFDVKEEELETFTDSWRISTGRSSRKGAEAEARIPKNLNMNSACVLTVKEKGKKESERKVAGLFMTEDDFIGANCQDGIIEAHENYRIWFDFDEPVYFWDFVAEDKRLKSWGSTKMKYVSAAVVKAILNRIRTIETESDSKEEIAAFNRYFSETNPV